MVCDKTNVITLVWLEPWVLPKNSEPNKSTFLPWLFSLLTELSYYELKWEMGTKTNGLKPMGTVSHLLKLTGLRNSCRETLRPVCKEKIYKFLDRNSLDCMEKSMLDLTLNFKKLSHKVLDPLMVQSIFFSLKDDVHNLFHFSAVSSKTDVSVQTEHVLSTVKGWMVPTQFFHGLVCLAEPLKKVWSCQTTYIPSNQTASWA